MWELATLVVEYLICEFFWCWETSLKNSWFSYFGKRKPKSKTNYKSRGKRQKKLKGRVEGMVMQWKHEMTWSEGCITADVISKLSWGLTHQSMQGTIASCSSVQGSQCENRNTPLPSHQQGERPSASHSIRRTRIPALLNSRHMFISSPLDRAKPQRFLQNHDGYLTYNGYLHFSFLLSYTSHTCREQDFMDKYKIQIIKVYCKNVGTLLQTWDKLAPP